MTALRRANPAGSGLALVLVSTLGLLTAGGAVAQEASPAPVDDGAVLPGEPNVPWDDGATPVTGDPNLEGVHQIRWDAILVAPGGQALNVYFHDGPPECAGLFGVEVQREGSELEVAVMVGDVPGAAPCTTRDILYRTVVVLEEPLISGGLLFDLPSG